MGEFITFKPSRYQSEAPTVTLIKDAFRYNASFVRGADIDKHHYVEYFVDQEGRRIGFKFHKEEKRPGTMLKLLPQRKNSRSPISGFTSSAGELFSSFQWINMRVSKHGRKLRNLTITRDARDRNLWIAVLQPTFEHIVLKELIHTVDRELKGVYRYTNAEDQVIYIGRGYIYQRYKDKDCSDWSVKEIQYAVLPDQDQAYWEAYYIDRFKEENEGRLPLYNRQSGKKFYPSGH